MQIKRQSQSVVVGVGPDRYTTSRPLQDGVDDFGTVQFRYKMLHANLAGTTSIQYDGRFWYNFWTILVRNEKL